MLRIALRQPRRSLLETLVYRQYDDPFPNNFAGRTGSGHWTFYCRVA